MIKYLSMNLSLKVKNKHDTIHMKFTMRPCNQRDRRPRPSAASQPDFAAFKSREAEGEREREREREREIRAKSRNAKDAKREESFLWTQCDSNAFRAFGGPLSLKSLYLVITCAAFYAMKYLSNQK